ncbi:uncharacterized protein [Physeter macrocephalus]|uniref:Uncharacterized protein n=1 Tax=Physeter macrocephalus TaxID=9755 RepID=A0A455BW62_PHYMC|nr:uncharacterized protein LOC114487461 [Physeter catodon]|eukprot:XP_028353239.1 uncharacterized protein LOC114487461 [Physeter catodon]
MQAPGDGKSSPPPDQRRRGTHRAQAVPMPARQLVPHGGPGGGLGDHLGISGKNILQALMQRWMSTRVQEPRARTPASTPHSRVPQEIQLSHFKDCKALFTRNSAAIATVNLRALHHPQRTPAPTRKHSPFPSAPETTDLSVRRDVLILDVSRKWKAFHFCHRAVAEADSEIPRGGPTSSTQSLQYQGCFSNKDLMIEGMAFLCGPRRCTWNMKY